MRRAATAGLAVPDTLISNDADRGLGFHEGNAALGRGTAVKSLWVRKPVSHDGGLRVPLTTVWPENVDPFQAAMIRLTPTLFQEFVPKRREIRVMVIGGEVFAAAVNSQAIPAARQTFRAAAPATYEPHDLPADIRAALLEVVRGFGLRFCSADLVLTPDGRYVFLGPEPQRSVAMARDRGWTTSERRHGRPAGRGNTRTSGLSQVATKKQPGAYPVLSGIGGLRRLGRLGRLGREWAGAAKVTSHSLDRTMGTLCAGLFAGADRPADLAELLVDALVITLGAGLTAGAGRRVPADDAEAVLDGGVECVGVEPSVRTARDGDEPGLPGGSFR